MSIASAQFAISRSFPWCEEHDDRSFLGQLHEGGVWDVGEYWSLESALLELKSAGVFTPEIAWRAFRVFSHTMLLLAAHSDPDDGFRIVNLSQEELHEFRERMQLAFEAPD